ncbi:polyisoprenoid-binding protein YceI [Loktanella ponticola]|jgi:polyisoprenoid-binding protein YceI|uniref:Polyisoprenoid-binding protein YceI n=1 Tax=Yoonia ponticola TaxID=1524255 RepID=A0A7W9BK90_9RHOB|nr:YceI family protein [Yoonia ponticola]MBB5722082.1 polyisoprenoid-binding protein YceI [Yoonia ponticola]
MKNIVLAALLASPFATAAAAAPEAYVLNESHSQLVFTYSHAGFSTTYGMYSGFGGDVMFDAEDPANSSVSITFPAESMITGWDARTTHFVQSGDFLKIGDFPDVTFVSTSIEVTGDDTANITGDLTLNGVTQSVVLETVLNAQTDEYPFPPYQGRKALGLDATTTLSRSAFNMDMFVPFVPDEVPVEISIEAIAAE